MKKQKYSPSDYGVLSMTCPNCQHTKATVLQLLGNSVRYCCNNKYCNEVFTKKVCRESSTLNPYEIMKREQISTSNTKNGKPKGPKCWPLDNCPY
jgi:hypothetical protein